MLVSIFGCNYEITYQDVLLEWVTKSKAFNNNLKTLINLPFNGN